MSQLVVFLCTDKSGNIQFCPLKNKTLTIIDGRENRGQLQLSVGLKVVGRVRGSQKPRPRLVHASTARGIIMAALAGMTALPMQAMPVFTESTEIRNTTEDGSSFVGDWSCGASGSKTMTINADGAYAAKNGDNEESGKWTKLQSLLEERGCTAKLTKDVVTEYLNYNLEYSLDAIYYSGAELLLFSDSADAEKANVYYNDPTEYSKGYRAWRVVMEADETAYNLYKDGKVLFAEGSGGYMMGRAAAQILRLLLEDQIPRVSGSLASQADGGKTFLCNPVVLRNVIETVEPEEQDTNSSRTAAVGIS